MAIKKTVFVLRNKINFTLSCGLHKNNHSNLSGKYFRFFTLSYGAHDRISGRIHRSSKGSKRAS